MDLKPIIVKLHPFERAVLPALSTEKELPGLIHASGLQEIEVMRALQWLENKAVLKIITLKQKQVSLDKNGWLYKKEGLPEKAFLLALDDEFKGLNVITKKSKLAREEINAGLGLLLRKKAIETKKEEILQIKITAEGKRLRDTLTPEEKFLQQHFPLDLENISDIQTMEELRKRKEFIRIDEKKGIQVELTPLGQELTQADLGEETINRLTSSMLKDSSWKKKTFRAYDVEINVPQTFGGKKHFVNQAIEYIRQIWLEMGFKEMKGNYVQSAFWDLDALFVPQDHPAREMQDTFYVEGKAQLPAELYKKVKAVHENGAKTGSTGWQYTFSEEETKKVLLRTHTTVLSAQTLSQLKKEDLPAKFFSVGLVFRNEALDWKHLFEFEQVEGIVVDPHANLKHLKGYLREFYQKMGFSKVRMRPGHFPYTEPSLEVDVFHPVRKEWIELGGAGIFRPEVVVPLLGFDCPVLAWGQGMGRIISDYWNITDIRELYKNDLKQLREIKSWLR